MRKLFVLVGLLCGVAFGQTPTPMSYAVNGYGQVPTVFVNAQIAATPTPTPVPTPIFPPYKSDLVVAYGMVVSHNETLDLSGNGHTGSVPPYITKDNCGLAWGNSRTALSASDIPIPIGDGTLVIIYEFSGCGGDPPSSGFGFYRYAGWVGIWSCCGSRPGSDQYLSNGIQSIFGPFSASSIMTFRFHSNTVDVYTNKTLDHADVEFDGMVGTTANLYIGYCSKCAYGYTGRINFFAYYNRALDESEIFEVYDAVKAFLVARGCATVYP